MIRGAILFAHNSPKYDYYSMAVATAKRINHFLDLPVTVVTDESSIVANLNYKFDNTVIIEPDKTNKRDWGMWINKGRYQAYEFSPYDETLLLDVDYIVNSDKLNKTFGLSKDFCCHNRTEYLLYPNLPQEALSAYSFDTLWATAVMFKKTKKAKRIFECLEMVQKNFSHYANIHGFISSTYRNDYALTLALRTVNGYIVPKDNIIPWSLMHLGRNTTIYKNFNDEYNTEYTVMTDVTTRGKLRKEYMVIKDMDFHMMDKDYFMDVV
jgi:hypothetical protein